jgi:hypothetical protein
MLLLELCTWPWLERLSNAHGRRVTLLDVPDAEWDRIASDGFNLVFLMGVWARSAIGREIARSDAALLAEYDRVLPGWTPDDVPGSPYCIGRYEPDERFGGWPGLAAARWALRRRGVGLILDFVPNHTGFDFPWVAAYPERYVLGTDADMHAAPQDFRTVVSVKGRVHVACGRDPSFPPWRDVAQLNYFNPETRKAMRTLLRDLAQHCDGLRCDMAMLALNDVFDRTWRRVLGGEWPPLHDEFWPVATREVPQLVYLAEVYWGLEGALLDQGFTFAYDKRLLDELQAPAAGSRIQALLGHDTPPGTRLARFIENHDEPRSASALAGSITAAAALAATLPGLRFFFDGQREGRKIRTPVQLARWPDEPIDRAIQALYERVLDFGGQDILRAGEWRLLHIGTAGDHTFSNLVAYRWRTADALAVIVANPDAAPAQGHIDLSGDLLPGAAFDFEDALTDARYRWERAALERTGLYVRINGGGAHLFRVKPA